MVYFCCVDNSIKKQKKQIKLKVIYFLKKTHFPFLFSNQKMIGIGHRLQKQTKIKILSEKAKEHNQKYESLVGQGVQPEEAMQTLSKQQFNKRHDDKQDQIQPYKNSNKINSIGGAINLGYTQTHKVKSSTKAMMQPIDEGFKAMKTGTSSNGFNLTKTPQQINEMNRVKQRIKKDHLAEDKKINLGDQKVTDYKKNFVHDQKMNKMCENKDTKFNQYKNDLKWYAETYIQTKDILRGR